MKKVKVLVIIREILIGILSYFVSLIVVILVIGNLPSLNYVDPKTGDLVINSLGALLILFIPLIFTILCIIFFRKLLKSKENKSSRISSTGSSPCYSLSHKESANDAYQQNLEKETVPRLKNNILTSEKSLKSKEEETNPLHTIKAMEDWFETNYKFVSEKELDEAIADGHTEIWDLAEYFGVTEDFMRKAVCWYTYGNLATELYF